MVMVVVLKAGSTFTDCSSTEIVRVKVLFVVVQSSASELCGGTIPTRRGTLSPFSFK